MIRRECARSGVRWHAPPTLDTGLLAQVVAPVLAGCSLESLAAWLGVEIVGRHSALGDATTAGRIFCAMVPRLRERGIRTLAEAMRASDQLHGTLGGRHRADWGKAVTVWSQPAPERVPADAYPYRHRVGAIMTSPVRSIGAETTLGNALRLMAGERISSIFISPASGTPALPADTGIVTERDVLRTLSALGTAAFEVPVGEVMSKPLATVPIDALAYVAIGRMNRLGIRHLGVTNQAGYVVGALSTRDLLRLHTEGAIELGDELAAARDVHDLGRSWGKLTRVAADLTEDGLAAREIAAVVSQNVIEMTRRAAELSEAAMKDGGHGGPPCRYALVVLGSAGRGESLLTMDQDNALVCADDAPAAADRWFEQFAVGVTDILHEAGIPYCKGGVMARNTQWRGSQAEWSERIDRWVHRSSPQDLLSVDIFFDLRVAHGDAGLADTLWRHAFDVARAKAEFAKLLIESVGAMPAGLNWFGGFRTDQGRIDVKKTGLFGIVNVARALAVCHHIVERSTSARLSGLMGLKLGLESDLDGLIDAQAAMLDLILDQQIDDIKHGRRATNTVEVKRLSRRQRARLRTALQSVENLDEIARSLLFRD